MNRKLLWKGGCSAFLRQSGVQQMRIKCVMRMQCQWWHTELWLCFTQNKNVTFLWGRKLKALLLQLLPSSTFLPSFLDGGETFQTLPLHLCTSSSLILLLLLFEQFVDLPLGHGRVFADDAMLVQSRQQKQETHCGTTMQSKLLHVNLWARFTH